MPGKAFAHAQNAQGSRFPRNRLAAFQCAAKYTGIGHHKKSLARDLLCFVFCLGSKCRQTAVKAQRQQFIAVRRGIHGAKPKFFGKGLIGKPGLLFFCPQHTNAGFSLLFLPAANNIPSAFFRSLFHLPRPAPRGSRYTNNFPLQSAPSRFQRSIFDEYTVFPVQLSKNMPFFQPIAQRFSFCLHSGMRFSCG